MVLLLSCHMTIIILPVSRETKIINFNQGQNECLDLHLFPVNPGGWCSVWQLWHSVNYIQPKLPFLWLDKAWKHRGERSPISFAQSSSTQSEGTGLRQCCVNHWRQTLLSADEKLTSVCLKSRDKRFCPRLRWLLLFKIYMNQSKFSFPKNKLSFNPFQHLSAAVQLFSNCSISLPTVSFEFYPLVNNYIF